jgi:hypothetical protein
MTVPSLPIRIAVFSRAEAIVHSGLAKQESTFPAASDGVALADQPPQVKIDGIQQIANEQNRPHGTCIISSQP